MVHKGKDAGDTGRVYFVSIENSAPISVRTGRYSHAPVVQSWNLRCKVLGVALLGEAPFFDIVFRLSVMPDVGQELTRRL